MPRDVAKLSEVVFHKSISVFIPPLGEPANPVFCHRGGLSPRRWTIYETGQGILVTPLQMVRGLSPRRWTIYETPHLTETGTLQNAANLTNAEQVVSLSQ